MKLIFIILLSSISFALNAQIDSALYFYDQTYGKLNMIHKTIKVEDGIIISGEVNVNGYEHPLVLKIDFEGKLIWSTLHSVQNGTNGQNTCRGFDIWLGKDNYIYGVSSTYNITDNKRYIWKLNSETGSIIYIKQFYQDGYVPVKLLEYDSTTIIATYKKTVAGQETTAMLAYISKQTGDTLQKFQMGTCIGEFGASIDKNKNLFYWRDNNFTKFNRKNIGQILWTKTYELLNNNPLNEIHDVYIDAMDNIFLFGRNGGSYGHGDAIVAKISILNGNLLWKVKLNILYSYIKKSDFIDKEGKLYISYRHTMVGSVVSNFTIVKLDKQNGIQDWLSNTLVTSVGTNNPSGGDETAILSIAIDCNNDIYATGYYNDANYGPAVWGNMKLSGLTGVKIYDKTMDLTSPSQDLYSQGLSSFVNNDQSIILGQMQNLASPNLFLSDSYFSAYDSNGNDTVMKRIASQFSIPSKTIDIVSFGDTNFILKQEGQLIRINCLVNGNNSLWNVVITSPINKINVGGLLKVTNNKVLIVYKENLFSEEYPYMQSLSSSVKMLVLNRSTGTQLNTPTFNFVADTLDLREIEADDNLAIISYFKDGNSYVIPSYGLSLFGSSQLLPIASSLSTYQGIQNCILNISPTTLLAVDQLQIKMINKSTLAQNTVYTFSDPRTYNDIEIINNQLHLVGKDQDNKQLYSIYDFTSNSLILDDRYEIGEFFHIDRDSYNNHILSGQKNGNIITRYINNLYNTTVWEKTYSFNTSDEKVLYSSQVNPLSNVLSHTGAIKRTDGSQDFFINCIDFLGDTIFTAIIKDSLNLQSRGLIASYSSDSTTLIGGNHNRDIRTREGVIFEIGSSSCKRIITGNPINCSGSLPTVLSASDASNYQWMLNGNIIPGATNQTFSATQAGRYNCIFTDDCGQDTSVVSVYVDNVDYPSIPVILTTDTLICPNEFAILSTNSAFHYQWFLNGQIVANSNNDTLFVSNPGVYSVQVMNSMGCTSASLLPIEIDIFNPIINSISATANQVCANSGGLLISNGQESYQWFQNGQIIPGATNDTLSFLSPGIYNVVVGDTNGCLDSLATGIIIENFPSTVAIIGNHLICNSTSQYLICSPSQSYQWYLNGSLIPGATNDSLLINSPGMYNVHVINSNGCADSSSSNFIVSTVPFAYTISTTSPWICPQSSVVLSTTGGQLFYQWYRNGSLIAGSQSSIQVTQPGFYNVQITNLMGCTDTLNIGQSILIAPNFTPTISGNIDTICPGQLTSLVVSPGASYVWKLNGNLILGATDDTLWTDQIGSYSSIVTDGYGCNYPSSNNFTINFYDSNLSVSGLSQICNNGSTIITSTLAQNYQWILNGNILPSETSQNLNAEAVGQYSLIITDMNGCLDTLNQPFTINYFPSTSSIIMGSNDLCVNQSQYIVCNSSQSYQWYKDGNLISGATNDSLLVSSPGSYNVIVVNDNGCVDSLQAPFIVSQIPFDYQIFSYDQWLCSGPNEILIATPNQGFYQWYLNGQAIGANQNSISILQPGVYNVEITDVFGCTDTLDVGSEIFIFPNTPVSIVANANTICSGSSTLLIASLGNSYQWYHDGNFISSNNNDSIYVTQEGQYTVEVSNSFGCINQAQSPVTISFFPSNAQILGDSLFCLGEIVSLTSNPALSYQWYENGTSLSGETNQSLNVNSSGSYSVSIIDLNGCSDSTSIPFNVMNFPSNAQILGDSLFCLGEIMSLTSNPALSYQWYENGTFLPGETNQSLDVNLSGSYTVSVVDLNGCSDSTNTPFNVMNFVPTIVTFQNTPYVFCENDGPQLLSVIPSGGVLSGPSVSNSQFQPSLTGEGQFVVNYTGIDNNGCSYSNSANITVNPSTLDTLEVDTVGNYSLNGITYQVSGVYTQTLTNIFGCDSVVVLNLNISGVGLSHIQLSELNLFPNPSTEGIFNLKFATNEFVGQQLIIYDTSGRKIKSMIVNNLQMIIDLSDKQKGVYLIHLGEQYFSVVYQ